MRAVSANVISPKSSGVAPDRGWGETKVCTKSRAAVRAAAILVEPLHAAAMLPEVSSTRRVLKCVVGGPPANHVAYSSCAAARTSPAAA